MAGTPLTVELGDDAVGVVTLNRPDKRNALNWATFTELAEAAEQLSQAAAERRCRAVMVTGAGEAFSSGLDTSLFTQATTAADDGVAAIDDETIAQLQATFTAFEQLSVPTIAAVGGPAVGGGCQLALCCHLRIASADASFALAEARWGLVPDLGATYRLPRLVGLSRATELAVDAHGIDAATAASWGLVNAVYEADSFADQAREYAARLAAGPTVALGAIPELMRAGLEAGRDEALARAGRAQQACLASADFAEAATAAAAGRAPRFEGR
jgi:enoyl-CoA hydratase/carnithine racemase